MDDNGSAVTDGLTTVGNANTSEDIVKAGCLGDTFGVVACVRYGLMTVIIIVTGALCVYRIYRLHVVRHQALHHYLIFYSSLICCTLCAVHWVLGDYAQLDFLAQWFKQLGYLVVTHFFWTRAHRAIRRERLTNFCLLPGLVVGLLYCSVTVILGVVMVNDYKAACLAVEWVMMSSAELFIAQMFLLAGFFISKRLDNISTIRSVRSSQKFKLWSLVIVLEVSAVVAFSYDLSMLVIGSQYQNCGRIFHFNQPLYSSVFGPFMVIKFALPIWAFLVALEPIESAHIDSDDDQSESFQSSDQSPIVGDGRAAYTPRLFQHFSHRNQSSTNNSMDTEGIARHDGGVNEPT